MDVEVSKFQDHRVCVKVTGRIDALNFELFDKKLKTMKRMGYVDLVLNFKEVTFINISAMILILQMSKEFNKDRDGLVILNANSKIKNRLNEFGSKYLKWETST